MKTIAAFAALLIASVAAAPFNSRRQAAVDEATIARLAPDLGAVPPLAPTGFGDCQGPVNGPNGKPASVPCSCPPTRGDFIAALTTNVLAGKAVNNTGVLISYPTGDSVQDQLARITASAITLQNLVGPGKGCPLVATTLGVQAKALQAGGTAAPAPAASTAAPAGASPAASPTAALATPSSASAPSSTGAPAAPSDSASDVIRQLAPDLGVTGPLPPTGRGDCQGPVTGKDGQPISVPCQCPPARDVYIAALTANVIAGKAINNPEVPVTFPTGNSAADKQARINAASVTLQNLEGPGKGCPFASTTLGAQSKAIAAGEQ